MQSKWKLQVLMGKFSSFLIFIVKYIKTQEKKLSTDLDLRLLLFHTLNNLTFFLKLSFQRKISCLLEGIVKVI